MVLLLTWFWNTGSNSVRAGGFYIALRELDPRSQFKTHHF